MDFQPKKPSAREELIGRLAVVAIALLLIAIATGMMWFSLVAFREYISPNVILLVAIALFLYAAALTLVCLTFAPKSNQSTGQAAGFEALSRVMDGLSNMIVSLLECFRWFR